MSKFIDVLKGIKSTLGGSAVLVKDKFDRYSHSYSFKIGRTKIGSMDITPNIEERDGKRYMGILLSKIYKPYQGKGLGLEMYKQTLQILPKGIDGLYSEKYTRHNDKAVPAIHAHLGGIEDAEGTVWINR